MYIGRVQGKQLSTNDVVVNLDAVLVAIMCGERWSKIHGIRPLNTMTVGDVQQTLCKRVLLKAGPRPTARHGPVARWPESHGLAACGLRPATLESPAVRRT